jgi:hypothetical protein
MDMFPRDDIRKMVPRFNEPYLVTKKVDRGAVVIRLQGGTETVAGLYRVRVFKG